MHVSVCPTRPLSKTVLDHGKQPRLTHLGDATQEDQFYFGAWGMEDGSDALIEMIYEAGLMPALWPVTLDRLAEALGARGALLMMRSGQLEKWTASTGLAPVMQEFVDQGWAQGNVRSARCRAAGPHPGFLTDTDLVSSEELETLPIYTEFLKPRGLEAGAGTIIQGFETDGLMFTVEGFGNHVAARIAVHTLNKLRPHIARATAISARLKLEQAGAAVAALAAFGMAAAVLAEDGRVLSTNGAFVGWIGDVFSVVQGRLAVSDVRSNERFTDALEATYRGVGRSIAVHKHGEPKFVLHLVPFVQSAREVFQAGTCLAVVDVPSTPAVLEVEIIQKLYDLTLAEAKVANLVANGGTPAEVARSLNVSVETVRTHLKHAFEKTGAGRQAVLASQLRGMTPRRFY